MWSAASHPPTCLFEQLRCNLTRAPNPDGSESRVVVDWYYGEAHVVAAKRRHSLCQRQKHSRCWNMFEICWNTASKLLRHYVMSWYHNDTICIHSLSFTWTVGHLIFDSEPGDKWRGTQTLRDDQGGILVHKEFRKFLGDKLWHDFQV